MSRRVLPVGWSLEIRMFWGMDPCELKGSTGFPSSYFHTAVAGGSPYLGLGGWKAHITIKSFHKSTFHMIFCTFQPEYE